ncbi:hypothetical protein L6452_27829 [Arctium lappa]|uniref:Uncharacterized protein n=1 Tax=Arctium lappa TaxID=4217 RepID=A0ACB8ZXL5_ARCLA|nr:hypothetical protein L6452_27829 [Arctium lappa]
MSPLRTYFNWSSYLFSLFLLYALPWNNVSHGGLKLRGTNVLRYLGRTTTTIPSLYQGDAFEIGQIDEWLDYAPIFSSGSEYEGACKYVDGYLLQRTFLVGHSLSIADMAVWSYLAEARLKMEEDARQDREARKALERLEQFEALKFDDNWFGDLGLSCNQGDDLVHDPNVGTNQINLSRGIEASDTYSKPFSDCALLQSHASRTSRFNTEMSPTAFFGGFPGMQIPPGQTQNLFPESNFHRNVLNFRFPVSYQRGIPALDLAVPNGLYRSRQNGMLFMEPGGIGLQPNLPNGRAVSGSNMVEGLEASEDSLIIHCESVNQVRKKVVGGFRGQKKECSLHESGHENGRIAGGCENGRITMTHRSVPSPIRCNTLADAQGYILMFAKDQNGCRYLQSAFDEGNPQHVQMVFNEIIGDVVELMINPFGNYLMQKLLEVCNEEQKMHILMEVTREPRELVQISLNTHGTRVVQKLIETLKTRQQIKMVISALEPGFLALIKDLNGNHVIQRCLQCLTNEDNKFIFEAAAKFCVDIATHQHGCCVLQRCINHSTGKHQESLVLEISSNGLLLAQDAFGNYVVQSILELQIPSAVSTLISQFEGNYVHLATQKFSSHVVEKCLSVLDDRARSTIICELLSATHFEQLLQDPHANYVVQTALRVAEGTLHNSLVKAIESHKAISRNSPYSKRIFSHKLLKK